MISTWKVLADRLEPKLTKKGGNYQLWTQYSWARVMSNVNRALLLPLKTKVFGGTVPALEIEKMLANNEAASCQKSAFHSERFSSKMKQTMF